MEIDSSSFPSSSDGEPEEISTAELVLLLDAMGIPPIYDLGDVEAGRKLSINMKEEDTEEHDGFDEGISDLPQHDGPNDPPPRRAGQSKLSKAIARNLADPEAQAKIKELQKESLFFDHQSPGVRKLRASARALYEQYCEAILGRDDLTVAEMYDIDTITERTCNLLYQMAAMAVGRIGKKPNVSYPVARQASISALLASKLAILIKITDWDLAESAVRIGMVAHSIHPNLLERLHSLHGGYNEHNEKGSSGLQ